MELFRQLTLLMLATESTPLCLGNVELWIDPCGPWAGQLSFSIPTAQWDARAIGESVQHLSKRYPEVSRIVTRYSN